MWTVARRQSLTRARPSDQGESSLTDDPGSSFTTVWNAVVAELNGDPPTARPRRRPRSPDAAATSVARAGPSTDHRRGLRSAVGAEQSSSRTRSNAICGHRSPTRSAAGSASRSSSACASRRRPRDADDGSASPATCSAPTSTPTADSDASTRTTSATRRQRRTRSGRTYFTERRRDRHRRRRGEQPQPALHVRHLRHRRLQPVRPRRRPGDRRGAGPRLQPAVHLG